MNKCYRYHEFFLGLLYKTNCYYYYYDYYLKCWDWIDGHFNTLHDLTDTFQ